MAHLLSIAVVFAPRFGAPILLPHLGSAVAAGFPSPADDFVEDAVNRQAPAVPDQITRP